MIISILRLAAFFNIVCLVLATSPPEVPPTEASPSEYQFPTHEEDEHFHNEHQAFIKSTFPEAMQGEHLKGYGRLSHLRRAHLSYRSSCGSLRKPPDTARSRWMQLSLDPTCMCRRESPGTARSPVHSGSARFCLTSKETVFCRISMLSGDWARMMLTTC